MFAFAIWMLAQIPVGIIVGKFIASGRTDSAAGSALHGRPGCNSENFPLHEDAQ
ncbi:hypothetical protein [Sphingobium indicum]|uniref:hypothetical protein n=1 Tax=Sphingobium indicum TaxID=332055 RepID=UPI001314ADF9|nr:hypothetical protein [Sphingobium indicum]